MSEQIDFPSPREVFERMLHATERNAWDEFVELYAEKFVIEMPFAPPGFPLRFEEEREAYRSRLKAFADSRQFEKIDGVVIHETLDPEVIVGEYQLHGKHNSSGRTFTLSYIMVTTVRHGRIVFSRDYSNPIGSAVAYGRLPELITALSSEQSE